ncbi:hypothetical protein SAMD00019534_006350 [Acytostelium subglobosum LB1]|uniref:hypothetical protein n=1 Tax=Acytostelium subglobosum LB1 TaxID=1410327 RepID=UPI000644B333|nr:hypothetical protein SAMD00019534_006350 [Acytostelium subglobosum LB1]GAM17460.1 hypothetical protein SAMD00019534_006350 [Acytostelium subglobosum LB1]|eukprot:XP_012759522.1 hypothetical protein SAMD00019534_006350 [Acytostelium subglobosum LB1]
MTFGPLFNQFIAPNTLPPTIRSLKFSSAYNNAIAIGSLPPSLTSLTLPRMFDAAIEEYALPDSLTELEFDNNPGLNVPDQADPLFEQFHNPPLERVVSQLDEVQGQGPRDSSTSTPDVYLISKQVDAISEYGRPAPQEQPNYGPRDGDPEPNELVGSQPPDPYMIGHGNVDDRQPPDPGMIGHGYADDGKPPDPSMIEDMPPDPSELGMEAAGEVPPPNHLAAPTEDSNENDPGLIRPSLLKNGSKLEAIRSLPEILLQSFQTSIRLLESDNPHFFPNRATMFRLPSLPPSLTRLKLGHGFQIAIVQGYLPDTLTELELDRAYKKVIMPYSLPVSLTVLTMNGGLKFPTIPATFPPCLNKLSILGRCLPTLYKALPSSLESLILGHSNKYEVEDDDLYNRAQAMMKPTDPSVDFLSMTSTSLTKLVMFDQFNQDLMAGHMPETIKDLVFGRLFNQVIHIGSLPSSLTRLMFGRNFDQPVDAGTIPMSLTDITFGYCFNQPIAFGTLALKSLTLGAMYEHSIEINSLPESLTHLTMVRNYCESGRFALGSLPASLTKLTIGPRPTLDIPRIMEFNIFSGHTHNVLEPGSLPILLESLDMGGFVRQSVDVGIFPDTLTALSFGVHFNQVIEPGVLPSSIRTLILGQCFNHPLAAGVLPASLTELSLGHGFKQYSNQEVLQVFPSGLRRLSISDFIALMLLQPSLVHSIKAPISIHIQLVLCKPYKDLMPKLPPLTILIESLFLVDFEVTNPIAVTLDHFTSWIVRFVPNVIRSYNVTNISSPIQLSLVRLGNNRAFYIVRGKEVDTNIESLATFGDLFTVSPRVKAITTNTVKL